MRVLMTMALVMTLAGSAMAQGAAELKVGDMAPEFSLQGTDGNTHALSDYKGKQAVVVAWFPRAFTRGCTIECKSLTENGDKIRQFDVAYFMVSVDTIDDNTGFAKEHAADFPILSDPEKTMTGAYGVLSERGFANRWTYYVDAEGVLAKLDQEVSPRTAGQDLTRIMGELGFPRKLQ